MLLLHNLIAISLDLLHAFCCKFVSFFYRIPVEISSLCMANAVKFDPLSKQSLGHLHPYFSSKVLEIVQSTIAIEIVGKKIKTFAKLFSSHHIIFYDYFLLMQIWLCL